MNFTDFCLKRPVTTVMFFAALVILGIVSYSKMKVDLFPEVTYPTLNVSVNYSGAGPEEIEQMITIPLEQAVATVNGVKNISSVSQEGSARVTAEFDWGRDLRDATDDLRASLDRVARRLPEDADTPTVSKMNPSSRPILSLGVSGEMNEYDLRRFAEEDLTNMLQRVDGVASVDVMGGKKREIGIRLHNDRLQAFGVTADQVVNALKNENAMLPAGHLTTNTGDFLLRTQAQFGALDDMENLVVTDHNNTPIYLKTLADVDEGFADEQSIVRIDGRPGIVVSVSKRSDANTVATADQIYEALNEVKERYPEAKVRILNDNSTYIRNSVRSVTDSAWQGGVLAALVLLFFLGNLRMTSFAAIVMPISILSTLILAYFSKMTLNTISLGGLALGVGMLVDNTVVVLDNIFRHYHRGSGDVIQAAREGTAEMGPALMASTITTVCVFFPLVFLTGRNGIIYKELSYMVIYSLMCSMLVSITLIPMLCAKFLKTRDLEEDDQENRGIKGILFGLQHRWETAYEKMLRWAMARKVKVIIGCTIIFLLSITLTPLIGEELVQNTDEGIISINLQLPSGTQLAVTNAHADRVEREIRKLVPEISNEEVTVGGRWGRGGQTNRAYLTIRLKGKEERHRTTQQIVELLQSKIVIPGARVRVDADNSMRMFQGGSNNPVVVDVRGHDQTMAKQVAYMVMDKISKIPGITNPNLSRDEERPELVIRIDRKRAADLGVTAAQIASAFQTHVEGKIATVYRKDGHEYQVRVNLRESDRTTWKDLGQIIVSGRNGMNIPLSSLVKFVQSDGKVNIERKDQERNISVEAGITKRDLGSVIRDVKQALRKINLPEGITLHIAGDYEEQQKSNQELFLVLILSLILVYMVMAAQFESLLDPFLIMFTVPFGLSGVILTLFLTDTAFNSQVYLGFIMLGGIVVDNAIVLVSYFRILMEKGMSLTEAVIQGGKSRLRPVFMTTGTTILGLVPLALGLGEGGETQAPMARTVIGGLTFSTVLTLLIIPVIFAGVESMVKRLKERKIRVRPVVTAGVMILIGLVVLVVPSIQAASDAPKNARDLTINQAVELALQNNPASRIMAYRREEAESVYRENLAGKKARVFAELDAQSPEVEKDGGNRLAVTAEQKTYLKNLFGAKSLNDQIAEYNRSMTLIGITQLEQSLIYQTVETFQKAIRAQNDLRLARDSYERAKSLQDEIVTRSKVGLTDITDELGAEAKVSEARTQVLRSEKVERVALSRLKRLIGIDGQVELRLIAPVGTGSDPSLNEITDTAVRCRADLKLADESLKRSQVLLELMKLSKNIGMNLEWNVEKEHVEGGLGLTNQSVDGTTGEWQTGWDASLVTNEPYQDDPEWGTIRLTFKYNIFDGGRTKERIKQAELLVNQLNEDQKRIREDALLEVEAAYYDYLDQKDLLKNVEVQYNYHRVYLDAIQARMRAGLATVKDVLDAQTLLTQSEIERERIKTDLYLAEIKLLQVTGRLKADLR